MSVAVCLSITPYVCGHNCIPEWSDSKHFGTNFKKYNNSMDGLPLLDWLKLMSSSVKGCPETYNGYVYNMDFSRSYIQIQNVLETEHP